jgi:hypothetical protein
VNYKLECQGFRRNSIGEVQATITLVEAASGDKIFTDMVNLSSSKGRAELAATLTRKVPSLKGRDVESQLLELLRSLPEAPENEAADGKPAQAQTLVALAKDSGTFFHDGNIAFIALHRNGHQEIQPVRSPNYKRWLSRSYWDSQDGKVPNSDALNSALNVLEGFSLFDGQDFTLHNRVAWQDGYLWYDLSNQTWQAVRVGPHQWEIVENPPILFQRWDHQLPQVAPVKGGDPRGILKFLRPADDGEALLWLAYIGSCFIPDIPHPIPILFGDKGAGKTTRFRLLRRLLDPSKIEVISFPRDPHELVQALSHHWVSFFDNIAHLPDWISDALCRACTGEGFSKRQLFTDDADVIYSFRRCVGMTGVNVMANRPDLLDRSLILGYEAIAPNERLAEKEVFQAFQQELPAILGGFLDTLAEALALEPEIRLPWKPRMADFAVWGAAIALALGFTEAQFLQAYQENLGQQNRAALEGSLVATTLLEFMRDRDTWEGQPAQLLAALEPIAEALKISTKSRDWPKNPNWLTRRINEIKTNLLAEGILFQIERGRDRGVTLQRVAQNVVNVDATREIDRGPDTVNKNGFYRQHVVTAPPDVVEDAVCVNKMTTPPKNVDVSAGLSVVNNDDISPHLLEGVPSERKLQRIEAEDHPFLVSPTGQPGGGDDDDISWLLPSGRLVSRRELLARWEARGRPPIPYPGGQVLDLAKFLARDDLPAFLDFLAQVVGFLEGQPALIGRAQGGEG